MLLFSSHSKISRKNFVLGFLLILILTFTAYSQVFDAGFIWDDDAHVSQNPTLKDVEGLKQIWFEVRQQVQYYPLTFTAFWIQYQLWGNESSGYHLFNIFLHVINAVLVWALAHRLKVRGAFFIAAIFALHPVHVESVAWITELKNLLSTLFYLLSLQSFLNYCFKDNTFKKNQRVNSIHYLLALFFFLCALLSKTVVCTLPVILLLLVWWKNNKVDWKDFNRVLPFFVLAAVPAIHTAWLEANKYGAVGADWDFTFVERVLIASRAIWFYIGKLLLPINLSFSYARFDIDALQWGQYLYIAAFVVSFYVLWGLRKRVGRGPFVGAMFFIISISPALGFVDYFTMLYSFVADHYQYLGSIGLIALFTTSMIILIEKRITKPAVINLFFAVLVLICGILTWHQSRIYKNSITIYEDVIEKNPKSWFAYNNRGVLYEEEGNLKQALMSYTTAINLKSYAHLHVNRGNAYLKTEEYHLAIADYSKAIELKPASAEAYNNRGSIYMNLKEYELALNDFSKALLLKPDFVQPIMNIGIVYGLKKEYQKALLYFEKAIDSNEEYSLIYFYRSRVYMDMGEFKLALQDAKKAASLGHFVPNDYLHQLKNYLK